tara:strand:- start:719 stop:925 length:207 start_codon:yes stop_codon:yes gene_type:complete
MAQMPCPSCKKPLGLTFEFIQKNPIMQCPHCKTVMNFSVSPEIEKKMKEGLAEIERIKKKYKGMVKFG